MWLNKVTASLKLILLCSRKTKHPLNNEGNEMACTANYIAEMIIILIFSAFWAKATDLNFRLKFE